MEYPRTVRFSPRDTVVVSDVERNSLFIFDSRSGAGRELNLPKLGVPYLAGFRRNLVLETMIHHLDVLRCLVGPLRVVDHQSVLAHVADLNGDGRAEVVTGAGAGGGPHVRVFSAGNVDHELASLEDRKAIGARLTRAGRRLEELLSRLNKSGSNVEGILEKGARIGELLSRFL